MRGGMPPADAIVTLFSAFVLKLHSAPAAASCTPVEGDDSSAIRGGIAPPADAIVISIAAFVLRFISVPAAASCTPTADDESSAIRGGIAPADTIVT